MQEFKVHARLMSLAIVAGDVLDAGGMRQVEVEEIGLRESLCTCPLGSIASQRQAETACSAAVMCHAVDTQWRGGASLVTSWH